MRFSSVSSCPPRSTTKARGRWPCSLSGTETTAASATLHTGMVRWRGLGLVVLTWSGIAAWTPEHSGIFHTSRKISGWKSEQI